MRHLRTIVLIVLGLLVVYLLLLFSTRMPPISAERQAALALMEAPPNRAVGAYDAFPQLWLMRQDVPAEQIAAMFAADREAYLQAPPGARIEAQLPSRTLYPPQAVDSGALCPRAPASCLAYVRADPARARTQVAELAPLYARGMALRMADHARYGFPPSLESPIPPLAGVGGLQALTAAVRFHDGEHADALEAACSDLDTWRRLRSRTDMLILDMIGVAYGGNLVHLLADMLAELPRERELPQACTQALSPEAPDEFDQCDVWRGEYAMVRNAVTGLKAGDFEALLSGRSRLPSWLYAPFFNERATLALAAQHYARLCPGQTHLAPAEPGWMDRAFNPVGSILIAVAQPNFDEYGRRAADFAALLQALRTVVWLRDHDNTQAAMASRPASLLAKDHAFQLDEEAGVLRWPLLAPRRDGPDAWTLPLVASRLADADEADSD